MLAVALLVACSGRSTLDEVPPPISASFKPLNECSAPLWVPSGSAYYGGIAIGGAEHYDEYKPSVIEIGPLACDDVSFNRHVHVEDFYLDVDEVSPGCYERCVADGECEPAPPRAEGQEALFTSAASAAAFCAYRGGFLPSYAQLARAGSASAVSVGPPQVLLEWATCLHTSNECDHLLNRAPARFGGEMSTFAPHSDPTDVGPFGHYDLFGSQLEWTRTRSNLDGLIPQPHNLPCDGEMIEDPVDLGQGLLTIYGPGFGLRDGIIELDQWYRGNVLVYSENVLEEPLLQGWNGFRCAYDSQEPEP